MNAKIIGVGSYLPEKILTNADLEKMVDTSDEWITRRVGIKERHICAEDEFASDMAVKASDIAIKNSGLTAADIDLVLCSTVSAEMVTPTVSCIVQNKLGLVNSASMDLNAACSGFVAGFVVAQQFIKSGTYKNILLIGTDTMSKYTDWTDRTSCVLFGDGAGAVVLTASNEGGIISFELGSDGTGGKNLSIPHLKYSEEDLARRGGERKATFWMDGSEVFKFAVRIMAESTKRIVNKAGLCIDDIDVIVPHQANVRVVDGAVKRLQIAPEKAFVNVQRTGNMSSASVAVALAEAVMSGFIKKGDRVVLVGFGGGLTWASVLFEM